ncbi:hypothetical protein INT43_006809 [Umbelopsis isabellina]|uniref:EF-hand domain-containing protein n=1 Tax=Mortierella isabellina TaxID=91625 RepID=A0A8H7Q0S3_MORIS|nr:hypothetical protein INT43_006809 [Umbelopsis isabellina]
MAQLVHTSRGGHIEKITCISPPPKRKATKGKASQPEEEDLLEDIEQAFQERDPGDTGILESDTAVDALEDLGIDSNPDILERLDPENNGFVTYDNFQKVALDLMLRQNMSETAVRAFDIFDKQKKGQFDYETFRKIARSSGEEWNDEELYEMFVIADKNNDGVIDRTEFIEVLERIGLDS